MNRLHVGAGEPEKHENNPQALRDDQPFGRPRCAPMQQRSDQGTAAHFWQLLMAEQMPVVAFFVIKWLPAAPAQAPLVLGLQIAAALG